MCLKVKLLGFNSWGFVLEESNHRDLIFSTWIVFTPLEENILFSMQKVTTTTTSGRYNVNNGNKRNTLLFSMCGCAVTIAMLFTIAVHNYSIVINDWDLMFCHNNIFYTVNICGCHQATNETTYLLLWLKMIKTVKCCAFPFFYPFFLNFFCTILFETEVTVVSFD